MSEMIVPESSHDRICLEKSSCKDRSSILISESALGQITKLSVNCKMFMHIFIDLGIADPVLQPLIIQV